MRGGKVMIESERSSDQELEADDWRSTTGLLDCGEGMIGMLLRETDVFIVIGVMGVVDDGWDMIAARDFKVNKWVRRVGSKNLVCFEKIVVDLPFPPSGTLCRVRRKSDVHVTKTVWRRYKESVLTVQQRDGVKNEIFVSTTSAIPIPGPRPYWVIVWSRRHVDS